MNAGARAKLPASVPRGAEVGAWMGWWRGDAGVGPRAMRGRGARSLSWELMITDGPPAPRAPLPRIAESKVVQTRDPSPLPSPADGDGSDILRRARRR